MVSGKKRITAASRGFSLLEVIIVLGLMGIVLVTIATFARKALDDRKRRAHADAIAEDVYGVLKFINADTILASVNINGVTGTQRVINPLYQQDGDPVYEGRLGLTGLDQNPLRIIHQTRPLTNGAATSTTTVAAKIDPYIGRTYSQGVPYPITVGLPVSGVGGDQGSRFFSTPLNWSESLWNRGNNVNSDRQYFTDSSCQAAGAAGTVYFNQQFISCHENQVLKNSEIALESIHLVNRVGTINRPGGSNVSIDRVDVYVSFKPDIARKPGYIQQYIAPLMAAFRTKKITPNVDEIYLVRNFKYNLTTPYTGYDGWQLINKNGSAATGAPAVPSQLVRFNDLPDFISRLDPNGRYAIRFSFDGKGDYLRSDGLNSATKLCWNTAEGRAGPCIEAPSTELLTVKQRENPREFANLQVKDIILKGRFSDADGAGATQTEYYTASHTEYHSFKNRNVQYRPLILITDKGKDKLCRNARGIDCTDVKYQETLELANGAIHLPLQVCPSAVDDDGNPVILHPRISTAVSSVVSVLLREGANSETMKAFQTHGPTIPGDPVSQSPGLFFSNPDNTMTGLTNITANYNKAKTGLMVAVNRLGGVITQVEQVNTEWQIASLVHIEENNAAGKAWQYFNPPGLSIQVTTWCSSNPQPH